MNINIISIVAIGLYLITAFLLGRRLSKVSGSLRDNKTGYIALGMGAVILHAAVLYNNILTTSGLNLSFFNALSLIAWLIVLLLLLLSLAKPVESVGIIMLPLASVALLTEQLFPGQHIIAAGNFDLELHIVLSIFAYSLLSIAAVQAILLAIQDRYLHNKRPGGFIRALPPLQDMESMLFQIITLGFILLSLALISGLIYLEDMFAQHVVHKTVLSITAWFVFGILIWGRWQFGWRGRTAIRWTLSGCAFLLLAYVGSKLVLELILGR